MRANQNIKTNQENKKTKGRVPGSLYLLVLVLLVALVGGTLAKYFSSRDAEGTVRAKMFYFTSDFLNGTERKLNPGVTEVTFTVGNHEDDLRYAEMDISYAVTVSPALADGNVICDTTTLAGGSIKDGTITLKGMTAGTTYTVTVEAIGGAKNSMGGYKKTLTGTIVVRDEGNVYKYLKDEGTHVILTVWAQGYTGTVNVGYPDGIIPDNTDSVMKDVKTNGDSFDDSTSFAIDSDASHDYRFFYSGTTPSINDFTVTYSGKTATEQKPD